MYICTHYWCREYEVTDQQKKEEMELFCEYIILLAKQSGKYSETRWNHIRGLPRCDWDRVCSMSQ